MDKSAWLVFVLTTFATLKLFDAIHKLLVKNGEYAKALHLLVWMVIFALVILYMLYTFL